MNKIINQSELETSLKQAARLAVSGTREERSGLSGRSPADVAMRLRNELRIATLNWATVEAFNETFESFRDQLAVQSAWQPPLFAVRAVVRDVVLTLMRVTESPGEDNNLETISRILRFFEGMTPSEIAESTGASEVEVARGLEFLLGRVPVRWGNNQPLPINPELTDFRALFRPITDSLVAHAKVYSSLDLRRDVTKIRAFLRLVSSLSDAASMICNVQRDDLEERWVEALNEANRFWKVVAVGSRFVPSE